MPKPAPKRIRTKTLTAEEQRLIGHFVKEGGAPEKLDRCERLARVKKGTGAKILKRAHVQEEIKRRLQPIHIEQERQKLVADAVDEVMRRIADKAAEQEAQLNVLTNLPLMSVDVKKLEHELMRLVVGLDQEKHPQVKLAAIQAAFIVSGTLENGNIRRVMPPDKNDGAFGGSMYGDLYDKMHERRENGSNPNPPRQLEAEIEIHDLLPHVAPDLPPPGEEIENLATIEAPAEAEVKRRVRTLTKPPGFTVEIG